MKNNEFEWIVDPILEWYHKNLRILPWRQNKDPYRIWVSEIMLQQTRVEAVIPYYERFMSELPTIQSLADASEEQLMKLWEGLGYYSRVRNMQKAARMICEEFDGVFPQDYENIRKLPGIGDYTVGSISSIAFEKPCAAVDGNVLRVITRLTQNSVDIMDTKYRKQLTADLSAIYPAGLCGDFTQSLMELGAMVCLPNGEPKCEECPLSKRCEAYQNHTQMLFPVKKKKSERKIIEKTVFVLQCGEFIAIHKRESKGVLAGMWELPNVDEKLTRTKAKEYLQERGIKVTKLEPLTAVKHIFSHIEWHMKVYLVQCESMDEQMENQWVGKETLEQEIALPTAFKNIYDLYKERDLHEFE